MVDRAEFTWRSLHRKRKTKASTGCLCCIPFLLEAAAVLAAFVHPNHIAYLCSWGFTHLPPTCNFKLFGYI
ncbi:hypothetical protein VV86_14935 [Vibrio vulnificus]|nr:hypothetical protein VV86_14935 [Vibrio vulnificus]